MCVEFINKVPFTDRSLMNTVVKFYFLSLFQHGMCNIFNLIKEYIFAQEIYIYTASLC